MDAAASEFKPGEAEVGRGKISFDSPSIVKLSEFKPQMLSPGLAPDVSPASRRLASAAAAPEFKFSFNDVAADKLSEGFSRKMTFDSPSITRVSEFQPQGPSTSTYGSTISSPAHHVASSDGTCNSQLAHCCSVSRHRRASPAQQDSLISMDLHLHHLQLTRQATTLVKALVGHSSLQKQTMDSGAWFQPS
jgi:hypothetical protein